MIKLPALERLEEEFEKVSRELRIEVPRDLKTAAAHGDLSENSEYDAAKQRQTFLQARASQLSSRIEALASLKLDDIPKDAIAFGAKVTLEDLNTEEVVTYELVTPEEVDPRNGKISVSSPIGRALLMKKIDDEISIELPAGTREFVVMELLTLHDLVGKF